MTYSGQVCHDLSLKKIFWQGLKIAFPNQSAWNPMELVLFLENGGTALSKLILAKDSLEAAFASKGALVCFVQIHLCKNKILCTVYVPDKVFTCYLEEFSRYFQHVLVITTRRHMFPHSFITLFFFLFPPLMQNKCSFLKNGKNHQSKS